MSCLIVIALEILLAFIIISGAAGCPVLIRLRLELKSLLLFLRFSLLLSFGTLLQNKFLLLSHFGFGIYGGQQISIFLHQTGRDRAKLHIGGKSFENSRVS